MIQRITIKEYNQEKRQQSRGFYVNTVFKLPDGTPYLCDQKGRAAFGEIMRFRRAKKALEKEQLDLLGLPIVQSKSK